MFGCASADGWNDWLEQWVAYSNWIYSRTFQLTQSDIQERTVWLKAEGLDTAANIRCAGETTTLSPAQYCSGMCRDGREREHADFFPTPAST